MRLFFALVVLSFSSLASPASAQEIRGADLPAPTEEAPAHEENQLELVRLRAELGAIHAEGPEYATGYGLQLVFWGTVAVTVASFIELISQEISARWRFDEPPWFLIGGLAMGAVLCAIGVPLVIYGRTDSRSTRQREIRQRIEELDQTLSLVPSITPDGAGLLATVLF